MSFTRTASANHRAKSIAKEKTPLGVATFVAGVRPNAKHEEGCALKTHCKIRRLPKRATDRAPDARSAPLSNAVRTRGAANAPSSLRYGANLGILNVGSQMQALFAGGARPAGGAGGEDHTVHRIP